MTVLSFVLTVLIPILSYIYFKSSVTDDIDVGDFEAKYNIIIIWAVIFGMMITGCTYLTFNFPKYSIKRGITSLTQSILELIIILLFSQFRTIRISDNDVELIFDITGIFVVLITVCAIFIIKNLYDLIDFKINQKSYFTGNIKNKGISNKLKKCSNCKYMCRLEWKKCPICHSKLKIKPDM